MTEATDQFQDLLGRSALFEPFERIVSNPNGPNVVSIEADFGMGKTTFARLWEEHLRRNDSLAVIRFDAWFSDHDADPLSGFLGAITHFALTETEIDPDSLKKKLLRIAMAGGRALSKAVLRDAASDAQEMFAEIAAPIKAKLATLLGQDEDAESGAAETSGSGGTSTDAATRAMADALGDEIANSVFSRLTRAASLKEALDKLRDDLVGQEGGKVIVIIDELDRCRPDYALALLEAIKQLFDHPGFTFVLMISAARLESTANANYGAVENSEPYLSKFIDMRLRLGEGDQKYLLATRLAALPEFKPWSVDRRQFEVAQLRNESIERAVAELQPGVFSTRSVMRALDKIEVIIALYPNDMILLDLLVLMSLQSTAGETLPRAWGHLTQETAQPDPRKKPYSLLRLIGVNYEDMERMDQNTRKSAQLCDNLFGFSGRRRNLAEGLGIELSHSQSLQNGIIDYHANRLDAAQELVA